MFKLFKDNFRTTNDCIIIAIPLIVFLSIISWYGHYSFTSIDTIGKLILAIITMFIMTSGFVAAWLYMTKKAITLSKRLFLFDKDRAKALWVLLLSLPKGIGRLFLPIMGVISIYSLILVIIISIVSFIILHISSTFDIMEFESLLTMLTDDLVVALKGLEPNELLMLDCWYFLTFIMISIASFFTILWIPEIVYNEKNAFKALWNSILKIFINFKNTLILYLYISILIITSTVLNTFLLFNPILYFIVLMVYYYMIVYIVVLLFSYYERNYIEANE